MKRLISAILLLGTVASAQTSRSFGVASVKPTDPLERGSAFYGAQPDGFSARNVTLAVLIEQAYRLLPYQLRGGPDWLRRARFTVQARYPDDWSFKDRDRSEALGMLQTLLRERFHLQIHEGVVTDTVYILSNTPDKNPRRGLLETPDACGQGSTRDARAEGSARPFPCMMRSSPRSLEINGQPMKVFAERLGVMLGAPMRDETGLGGTFDIKVDWANDVLSNPNPADVDRGAVIAAVRDQLGLNVEASKGSIPVVVIESATMPAPD